MKIQRLLGAMGLTAICCLSFASAASGAEAPSQASTTVQSLLPGATASMSQTSSGGNELDIQLAPNSIPGGLSQDQQDILVEGLGWKARLAASIVYANDPTISMYQVTTAEGTTPSDAANVFHGGFYPSDSTSMPLLDSVDAQSALSQLNSNLAVLTASLPAGSVTNANAYALPIQGSTNAFALEADISLSNADDLIGHYGDVLGGLPTGLTGDYSLVSVEGLAIVVTSSDGALLAGSWQSTRSGNAVLDLGANPPQVDSFAATAQYPNLTGGPSTLIVALGGPSGTKNSDSSTQAIAAVTSRSGSLSDLIWVGLVLVLAFGSLIVRRQKVMHRTCKS